LALSKVIPHQYVLTKTGHQDGATLSHISTTTCIMNRLFSTAPSGLYTLTATVNNVPHAFFTAVPGTQRPQASHFFLATFSDVTTEL
jgi:hypothetical protein